MHSSRKNQSAETNLNSVSAAFEHLIWAAKQSLLDVAVGMTDSLHFDEVKELLAALPLTTDEHSKSLLRLRNGITYAAQNETGAARYELALLLHNLSKMRRMLDE